MTTRVFLHSPSEAPDASVIVGRMPAFERLGERALLLARPGDLVCVARPVDERYLAFLRRLGIGPRTADVLAFDGVRPGTGLSAAIAADEVAVDRLARALAGAAELELLPFFATPATAALGRALRVRLGVPVRVSGGPAPLVARLHQKTAGRALARRLGVPVAPCDVVRIPRSPRGADLAALRRAVLRRSRPTGRAILRGSSGASGSATLLSGPEGPDAVVDAAAARTDVRTWLVEPFYEAVVSPNVEVVVGPGRAGGGPLAAGVTDQLLDPDLVYMGSAHPSRARHLDAMVEDARTIARWLGRKGFRGRTGFDFVEHAPGGRTRRFLAEINPRVNGASYPLALRGRLARRAEGTEPTAFVARPVAVDARDWGQLEERGREILYDPRRGEGIVPWAPGAIGSGQIGVTALAGSRDRADELVAGFAEAVGAARSATVAT